jgi:S-disulfanyl-L-cysteine oxidoreductase SoxD
MFSSRRAVAALALTALTALCTSLSAQDGRYAGIGRAATAPEIAAWDIDVRADFKGLPKGSGSVAQGMVVWEGQCASCHGVFGESNETFTPLIGGTTAADIKSGRAARLLDPAYPGRTTMMKLATLSTLWDYIHRAMPWNKPKSLKPDEVYAVTAYMLNLGGVLPDDFVLSDRNIAQVQTRLPNRLGMSTEHALWPGARRKPDVQASACMSGCGAEPQVASLLPEHAKNQHGNLAEQNRLVGAQRGVDTSGTTAPAATQRVARATVPPSAPSPARLLLSKHNCLACHDMTAARVGPALREVAKRHGGRSDATEYMAQRIVAGSSGVWGTIPMPAQSLPAGDAKTIAAWLAAGATP